VQFLDNAGLVELSFPKKRFGYHVVYDRDIYDAVDFAHRHNFGYIVPDLMIPRFWPENIGPSERRRIRRYAADHGVSISFHGPSDNLNLAAPYPEVRRGILQRMKLCLELARDLEAERFTIHPSQPTNFASDGKPGTFLEDHRGIYADALRESMMEIAATGEGVQICVENEPLTPFVERVLEELMAEDSLFLTLDVPKAHDPAKGAPLERVESFYRRHIDRVKEAHLHDKQPGGTFHDILGFGEVEIGKYLQMLAPNDVHFTLEIRPRENAYRSFLWLENLWNELF